MAGFNDGTTCQVVAAGFHASEADALTLLDRAARPTAVFAVTDWGAAALYAAAQRLLAGDIDIEYLDYDWSLNRKTPGG